MSILAALLWWIVLGALLGWLASWLVGRGPRQALPAPVERVVERQVNNPVHVDRIAALESEVAEIGALRERIRELEAAPPTTVERIVEVPVERIVERIVEKPADAASVTDLEQQLAAQRRRASELEGQLLRLQPPAIDLQLARESGFAPQGAEDLTMIAGIDAEIAGLLAGAGIRTLHDLARSPTAQLRAILADGTRYRGVDPDTWPEQAVLAAGNHWNALKSLQETLVAGARVNRERERDALAKQVRSLTKQLADREAEVARLSAAPALDGDAARAAGFELKDGEELQIVEGIGARIAEVLHDAGITTLHALSQRTPAEIRSALARGGPNFGLVDPRTWSDQALLAANNRWTALATLQAALDAGRRK